MSIIKQLHEKLVNKEVTSLELTQKYFDEIEKKEKDFNAFISISKKEAFEQAEKVDKDIEEGKEIDLISGIPCALKDIICVRGGKTTAGSKMLENYTASYDATVTKKLKEKNAVIVGKTNCDEFACGSSTENSAFGITKNPYDLTRVPGGSSGGSAVAVASGEVTWTLGTDTGGSVRQPASFCGIVGLKPTYGRISRYGVIAYASSLDQVGIMTKTTEDAAIVLTRIAGRDELDATSAHSSGRVYEDYLTGDLKGKKIGIPREYISDNLDDAIKNRFFEAVDKYKKCGAEIVDISLPNTEYALATYYIIAPAELSSNLARFDGVKYGTYPEKKDFKNIQDFYKEVRGEGFGAEIKRRVMIGTYTLSSGYYDAYYKKAQKVRGLIRKDFEEAYRKVDYIFAPTTPETAFKIGAKSDPVTSYLSDIYTITANLAGVPAISHPIGTIETDGIDLPIGGQLFGEWFNEEGILNASYTFEKNF